MKLNYLFLTICLSVFFCKCHDVDVYRLGDSEVLDDAKLDKKFLFTANGGNMVATLMKDSVWKASVNMWGSVGNSESFDILGTEDENGMVYGDWFRIEHTDNPREISVTLSPYDSISRDLVVPIQVNRSDSFKYLVIKQKKE